MMQTELQQISKGADAIIGETVQGRLEEASQELQDQVKELIDERNDVDRIQQDKEEREKRTRRTNRIRRPRSRHSHRKAETNILSDCRARLVHGPQRDKIPQKRRG